MKSVHDQLGSVGCRCEAEGEHRSYIQATTGHGFADGEFTISITNIATRQTTVPPLAFPTRAAAQRVVDAIAPSAPHLYTDIYPCSEES